MQLTLHYTEDKTTEDDREEIVVEDDCLKCEQLRKMLNKSLKLPPVCSIIVVVDSDFWGISKSLFTKARKVKYYFFGLMDSFDKS